MYQYETSSVPVAILRRLVGWMGLAIAIVVGAATMARSETVEDESTSMPFRCKIFKSRMALCPIRLAATAWQTELASTSILSALRGPGSRRGRLCQWSATRAAGE